MHTFHCLSQIVTKWFNTRFYHTLGDLISTNCNVLLRNFSTWARSLCADTSPDVNNKINTQNAPCYIDFKSIHDLMIANYLCNEKMNWKLPIFFASHLNWQSGTASPFFTQISEIILSFQKPFFHNKFIIQK